MAASQEGLISMELVILTIILSLCVYQCFMEMLNLFSLILFGAVLNL
jgi:hypothetical protein